MTRKRHDESEGPGEARLCIVSRAVRSPDELIRFVASPDGTVVPDLRRRLPGRGVWVTATATAVGEAVRRRAFGRGLKRAVTAAPTLAEEVASLLRRDALQALSLANKAGAVVTGFGQVAELAERGKLAALLHAQEASPDGRRKVAQALRRGHQAGASAVPVIDLFSEADLGLALGRAHVIHAALVAGPGSDGFLTRWRRLARYCANDPTRALEPDGAREGSSDPDSEREGAGFTRNE